MRGAVLGAVLGAALLVPTAAWAGPPGMPDPKQMSGIPRPDPNLTAGTVTVRCLDGGFDRPAIGVEVSLEIAGAAGTKTVTATTADQGRALFAGLDAFFGQRVVAKATVAGQALRSQEFVLGPQSGIALMLVAGSASPTMGPTGPTMGPAGPMGPMDPQPAGAHGQGGQGGDPHGGQGAVPMPGKPFPLAGRPPGMLIVGALDLGNADADAGGIGPIPNIEITLRATVPGEAEPIVETATTDEEGRALFEALDEHLPAGAQIVVEATLEDGEEPERSESFTLGTTAYAVILTRGEGGAAAAQQAAQQAPQQQQPQMPPQRMQLPGPRVDKSLEPGQVRVVLLDAHDQPVAGHGVIVHSSQATGGSGDRTGKTDAQGVALVEGVPDSEDTLSQVRVMYEGAPYSSTLFEMPEDAGAIVMLRVFRPTGDRTRVRSALQIDVSPRENDYAAVSFNYAVFVDGDEAFWVPGGMTLYGPPGTRSFHVMDDAKAWLMHDEEAPWAVLDRPLEPGVEIRLSFAVGVQHDGALSLEWSTPFPLVEDASLVSVPAELSVTHGVAGAPEVDPHAGRGGEPIKLYELGYQPFAFGVCDLLARAQQPCPIGTWSGHDVSIVVEGLPRRSRVWPYTAWGLLGVTGLGVLMGIMLRRRVGAREALLTRRDALIAELVALDERGVDSSEVRQRRARMLRTLDRIYRQLEALGPGE